MIDADCVVLFCLLVLNLSLFFSLRCLYYLVTIYPLFYIYQLLEMFSVNSLLYSSAVNLYKLFALSAGINSFGSFFMLFTSLCSCCWNDDFTFSNSIFRTISYKSSSNAFKCSFFGGVLTKLKPKFMFDYSLHSEFLSKKNAFHLFLFMKLSSLKIKFFR